MKKSAGLLNGKLVSRSYNENDSFEFVVIELSRFKTTISRYEIFR